MMRSSTCSESSKWMKVLRCKASACTLFLNMLRGMDWMMRSSTCSESSKWMKVLRVGKDTSWLCSLDDALIDMLRVLKVDEGVAGWKGHLLVVFTGCLTGSSSGVAGAVWTCMSSFHLCERG